MWTAIVTSILTVIGTVLKSLFSDWNKTPGVTTVIKDSGGSKKPPLSNTSKVLDIYKKRR